MKLEITKQVLTATVRWLLSAIGLWMVKRGIIDPQLADQWLNEIALVIVGVIALTVPLIWKYFNAKFNALALIEAVQTTPPADTKKEIKEAVENVKTEVKLKHTASQY